MTQDKILRYAEIGAFEMLNYYNEQLEDKSKSEFKRVYEEMRDDTLKELKEIQKMQKETA